MAKPEWGTKRTCLNCDAHFYDMQRNPILCPRCNSRFIAPETSSRAQRYVALKKIVKSIKTTKIVEEYKRNIQVRTQSAVTLPHIEGDEESLRDAEETGSPSDLGADDDDVAEVMERLGS